MIPTIAEIEPLISSKLINRQRQGPLSIFNYSVIQTYRGDWTPVAMACRGLIINEETGEVVALPWPKFFNHGEWNRDVPIPPRTPDLITVKMDGCLGVGYRYEDRFRWSTRGSFQSDQSKLAQQMWDERYAHVKVPHEWTPLAEIIHEGCRIVVRYDYNDLVFLGARNRFTGQDIPFEDVASWAAENNLRMTELVEGDLNSCVARAKELDENNEGFVLEWDGYRVKVKGEAYCNISRILQRLTPRGIGDLWYFQDLEAITMVPEEHRREFESDIVDLDAQTEVIRKEVAEALAYVHENSATQREFYTQAKRHYRKMLKVLMTEYAGNEADYRLQSYKRSFGDKHPRKRWECPEDGQVILDPRGRCSVCGILPGEEQ